MFVYLSVGTKCIHYTSDMNKKISTRYKKNITPIQKPANSPQTGRHFGNKN